jgi:hypothetical protein
MMYFPSSMCSYSVHGAFHYFAHSIAKNINCSHSYFLPPDFMSSIGPPQHQDYSLDPPSKWSSAQVADFLRANGIDEDVIGVFVARKVKGQHIMV